METDPDPDMADASPDNFLQYQQQVKGGRRSSSHVQVPLRGGF